MIRSMLAGAVVLSVMGGAAVRAQPVPTIAFEGDVDFLKLPEGLYLGEASGWR